MLFYKTDIELSQHLYAIDNGILSACRRLQFSVYCLTFVLALSQLKFQVFLIFIDIINESGTLKLYAC